MQIADEALLERCGQGDQQAAALLINRHSPRVLALAQRMLSSREDAEDVTQEVFIKVYNQAATWESGKAKFTTWLHRVTLNQCYDRLRKKRETGMDEPPDMEDDSLGPAQQFEEQQRQKRLKQAISELPDRQRAALLLNHYDGLSNPETAEILEVSVEAVESLLSRARRNLRDILKNERNVLLGPAE